MPELPEVEITRLAIAEQVQGKKILAVTVRNRRLRWPVSRAINNNLPGQVITKLQRRAKYLIFHTQSGSLIVHLGMSGSLCCIVSQLPPGKHDHIDIELEHHTLRYHDPRRFGSFHWCKQDPMLHPLLAKLGIEPLSPEFDGHYLHRFCRGRKASIKCLLMNSHIVVGIGNIYANEALFLAGIDPRRVAGRVSAQRCGQLAQRIKQVLKEAITAGGTSLRDFVSGQSKPGYFQLHLRVYGRQGEPCPNCGQALSCVRIAQRASYLCRQCQR